MEPIPTITADQMREVDRVMIEDLGIELLQMMENAGRNLAQLTLDRYAPQSVTVLAGPGGNGGGGLVAARHLANRGVGVSVSLSRKRLAQVPGHQLSILHRMGVHAVEDPQPADVIIDAIIGYSLNGNPHGRAADLIAWSNDAPSPTLSLDTPSGLDVTSGVGAVPVVRADATMTLALPKQGLMGAAEVGTLYLADISVPPTVYARFGIDVGQLFSTATVIELGASSDDSVH